MAVKEKADATFTRTVTIDGAVSLGSTLTTTGAATLNSSLLVEGTATLSGSNNVGGTARQADRYYLDEYFTRKPAIQGTLTAPLTDADASEAANDTIIAVRAAANTDFEITGTNQSNDDITFSGDRGGIKIETDGATNDAIQVMPVADPTISAWKHVNWGTEDQVHWEAMIHTDSSIADIAILAGLKLGPSPVYATDADSAFFGYWTADIGGAAITTNANLHFAQSVNGDDYITDLGIAVEADKSYHLKIVIDADRKPTVYVNGTQYSLTSATTSGGVTTGAGSTLGPALKDDIDFLPIAAVVGLTSAAKSMHLSYMAISRKIDQ